MTKRRVLAATAASLFLSLACIALLLGTADLAGVTAKLWMRDWEKQGYVTNPEQWSTAYGRLSLARRLNPLDADHSANLGRLMDWQSWRHLPGGIRFEDFRVRARQYYQESVEKRPSWGYAWAHYAESRLLLGHRDHEFVQALENAIVLAPWEPGVQRKVVWMGLATWADLPDHLRVMVKENVRRTMKLDLYLDEVVRLAVQFEWLDHLVPMMQTDRQHEVFERISRQLGRR